MQRLESLLRNSPELRSLAGQAGDIAQLQAFWSQAVPPQLRPYTHAGSLKHRRITVFADNGAIAAKLKMLSASLLKNLQNKGLEVTSIRVEVQVQSARREAPKQPRLVSAQAAGCLETLAEGLPDSPLKTSLQRLANRK